MKKNLLLFTLLLSFLSVYAQRGMHQVGVGLPISVPLEIIEEQYYKPMAGAYVKYDYNFSNFYRLGAEFSWQGANDMGNSYQFVLNNAFYLTKINRIRPYFNIGIGYGQLPYHDSYEVPSKWEGDFITEIKSVNHIHQFKSVIISPGVGADFRLHPVVSLSIRIDYIVTQVRDQPYYEYPNNIEKVIYYWIHNHNDPSKPEKYYETNTEEGSYYNNDLGILKFNIGVTFNF